MLRLALAGFRCSTGQGALPVATLLKRIMIMDPDAALADIRHTIQEYNRGREDLDLGELIDLIDGLDQWISKGGYMPVAWVKKAPPYPGN